MTGATDEFIAEARSVDLADALDLVGAVVKGKGREKTGPCPVCGGKDRFSVNFKKGVWFCRQSDRGGDALALIAYRSGYDLGRQSGLLAACAELLARPIPEGAEAESDEDRAARAKRNADLAAKRSADRDKREQEDNTYREREIEQARGIYFAGVDICGTDGEIYLVERSGLDRIIPDPVADNLRFSPSLTYWHGLDELGRPLAIHSGPAIIAPIVALDGKVIGCHQTWVDLSVRPKLRPQLVDDDNRLPTKKMRGRKKGGLIPICGEMASVRWVIGEGIETVLAVAGFEQFPADTFYAAAGDIGNIAGPADPASAFTHPTRTKADKLGRHQPIKIAGAVPAADADPADAVQIPPWVGRLILLADGDSDFLFTAAALARAEARLSRPGLRIEPLWPPAGVDFADVAVAARQTIKDVA